MAHTKPFWPCSTTSVFIPTGDTSAGTPNAITFAGMVGVVSNNFGTLEHYKIPMIPFYVAGLYITESMSVVKGRRRPAGLLAGQAGGPKAGQKLVPA